MKGIILQFIVVSMFFAGCGIDKKEELNNEKPYIVAADQIQAGRYLVEIGGCNDCHTDGFMQNPNIPESEWLTGSPLGWRGPWGTTYPVNLRLTVQNLTEDQWVEMLKTRKGLPPMIWPAVNQLSESDSRAMYAYITSLGVKGERMPLAVAAGVEPQTPYLNMMPQNMPVSVARN